jgi:taurine dioxygenase
MSQAIEALLSRSTKVDVVPYGRCLAAEIRGVDFSSPMNDATADTIHASLMRYGVIFFRDVEMTPLQHVAFGRLFGDLTTHPFHPHVDGLPEVTVLDNHKDRPAFTTDVWHSDETFRMDPPMGTILRCIQRPPHGGDTLWADMNAAYEGLSSAMQKFLSGLEAVHDFNNFRRKFDHLPLRERHQKIAELEEQLPNPVIPVVQIHPVTGQKVLFVNELYTMSIKGLRADESKAVLNFLFQQAKMPEYQFRFHWEPNSMVFWENRRTQHYASNDYLPDQRVMHRVTVRSDERSLRKKGIVNCVG